MKKIIVFALAAILVVALSVPFVSAEATNVAKGKSYTVTGIYTDSKTGTVTYPDTGNKELTDGVKGELADINYASAIWVGLNTNATDTTDGAFNSITVDLGSVTSGLTTFSLYAEDCGSGIVVPKSVEVLLSSDGTNFTSIGSSTAGTKYVDKADAANPSYAIYKFDIIVAATSAKFVKFTVEHGAAWAFVSEVEVLTDANAVPNTSTPANSEAAGTSSVTANDSSAAGTSSTTAATSSTTKATSSTVNNSSKASTASEDTSGLSTGAIIGIAAGAVVVLALVVFLVAKKKK